MLVTDTAKSHYAVKRLYNKVAGLGGNGIPLCTLACIACHTLK